ncbi:putative ribonuclease H-like domain-containing protein [Tanacetum coccineum]
MYSTKKSKDRMEMQMNWEYDWSYKAQVEPTEFALMPSTSPPRANLEIVAYQLGLESVEAQLVVHQKNEVVYEEKINRSNDGDDNQTNDRFKKDNGYHVVPPPLTGNYMPPLANLSFAGLDDYVYRPTANKTSASVSQVSDDEDIFQSNDLQATDKPSFKRVEFSDAKNESIKPKQAKKHRMITQNPKVDRRDWNGHMTQKLGLGFGFTKKACFVCGSYSHLIKDCDFHEKRMANKSVLKDIGKVIGHREVRPVWNNTQRINHQNKFIPSAVLTRSGRLPVSAAKQSSFRAAASTGAVKQVNTATHKIEVNGVNIAGQTAVSVVKGNGVTAVKATAGCVWRPKMTDLNNGNPQQALKNKGIFDSGCSRHMTRNKDFLTDYQDIDGGFVAFGRSARGGKITGKGKIRTDKLDFEDVFFVKELKFNLFSVSQMCDKKNNVLFTKTECLVLSPNFKLLDESQVLLRVPRQSNMYSFDLKNVVPFGDLTCLFIKATIDESKLWHRRLGHVNFKTMNKLMKGNLVRGLPSKIFDNDHTCVACQKEKQHKASCKAKLMSSISQPLQMLHMDLLGLTSVRSINHKTYCLVVTDDFSREMNELCRLKGIKREFSVAKTLQQNGVAERKNMTLIEAARTMLQDPHSTYFIVGPKANVSTQQSIVFPLWSSITSMHKSLDEKYKNDAADDAAGETLIQKPASENEQTLNNVLDKMMDQEKDAT